jgi:predicted dehydrogenase
MKNSEPVGVGIVGIGALSQRALLPHLVQEDLRGIVELRAVCDSVPGRAKAAADRYGIPRYYESLEDMLSDEAVDAVSIASPIGLHAQHGLQALQARKHVHFNKTMTTTVAEADEVIAAADRSGVHIVASPGEGLRPQLQRTRQLIESGAIGRLSWAICGCAFGRYHESEEPERLQGDRSAIDPSWYFKAPGGGPLYDMTAYSLHGLTSVLGPATKVTALSGLVLPTREFAGRSIEAEMDDNSVMLLDFGEGRFAVAHGTATGTIIEDFGAACYFGTEGEIRGLLLNGEPFDFPGRELTLDAPTWDWDVQMRVLPHVVGPHAALPEAHVFEDIMQLVDWIREGKPSPVTAEHARHVIDIIESSYRSARGGKTETLTTSFVLPDSAQVGARVIERVVPVTDGDDAT